MEMIRRMTFFLRPLPDFLIIGAQKGGTSSLFTYLSQHPQLHLPGKKEIHYFDYNYHKGINWYRSHFPLKSYTSDQTGEASPYYLYHPLAARRIFEQCREIKLIVLLRDPVARAYSHYMMERKRGNETIGTFQDALLAEQERLKGEEERIRSGECRFNFNHQTYSYATRGLYFQQLKRWFEYFPRNKFLFIKSETFFRDPESSLSKVYDFLGLNSIFPDDLRPENVNEYIPLSTEASISIRRYFANDAMQLKELLGEEFSWVD